MKKILKVLVLVLLFAGFTIGSLYAKQGSGTETNPNIMADQYIDDGYAGGESNGESEESEGKTEYQYVSYTKVISDFDATLINPKNYIWLETYWS